MLSACAAKRAFRRKNNIKWHVNRINSDWKKLRRFAIQLFPAGYAERSVQTAKSNLIKSNR